MDHFIDEIKQEYDLSDCEALIVVGVIGLKAIENKENINEIYYDKLQPAIEQILNK